MIPGQPPADDYSRARTVFVIGNCAIARSVAAAAVAASGLRVVGQNDLTATPDDYRGTAIAIVEIDDCQPCDADLLDRLLAGLNTDIAAGRVVAIVSTPAALIDRVAAALPALTHQLADATDADRIAALLAASAATPSALREATGSNELVRLARLTEEVARVAAALATRVTTTDAPRAPAPPSAPSHADEIRALIRARRLRAQYFEAELFADPAWDMLLDLAAAHATRERVAVSSLCIAAAVPPTTALRWIRTLTDAGLFVRTADPADGRRVFIELSASAAASMQAYMSARRSLP